MDVPVDLLPTHIAAAKNDVQELARLVQQGELVIDNDTKESPLHAAARTGSVDALHWLLENRVASPLTKASNGNTAAHYAVVYGHAGALKLLITNDPSISDQVSTETDENGLSILSLATLQGDEELVLWILDNFPHVVEVPNTNGNLAVHFAAAQGFLQILKLLVRKCGREIAEKQDNRLTKPVFFASQEGKLDVLDYLINELGVDPVARDKSGMSCVHAATQGGQSNAIKWLISKLGPKYILDKTIDGATPLHMAAALGHSDILRFFLDTLEDKNDIDVLDHIHATPAHDAAEYGQTEAMILLLQHGANINIKDTENKTPYELAVEQDHTEVATIISDFRENGPAALAKYEKGRRTHRDGQRGEQSRPRTSRQEAAEISNVIQQTTEVIEQRKEHQKRQDVLTGNGRGERMDTSDVESKRKTSGSSQRKTSYPSDGEDEEIEHTLGPQGDIYARPRRRKHRKSSSRQNSDVEEFMSETMSHHSFSSPKAHPSRIEDVLPLNETPYAVVSHGPNLETASNYSRPSRVKRYQDSDSEISSFTSSHHYRDGRHNFPGFYPGFAPHFPPPIPTEHRKPHSVSGASRHSSQGGHHRGYPPPPPPHMAYGPYGFHPGMMAAYYGYPPYPPYAPGYHPKTTEERMHLAALQHGRIPPGHYQYPGMYMQGRRSALAKQPKRMPGPPKQHTDQDIGYGPEVGSGSGAAAHKTDHHDDQEDFHPPAPPVTLDDGSMEQGHDMVAFDSNFIMTKKTEGAEVRQVAGTTLNPAKAAQKPYDGRWDEYITSDSEEEGDVEEQFSVSFAAEAVAILAIGCVAGLKGLQKVRKGKPSAISDVRRVEKSPLSSAWDAEPRHHQKDGSRKGPIDDPRIKGMSPEEFASHEEWEGSNWDKSGKKGVSKPRSSSTEALDKPQSELLTAELQKQSFSSVSKHLGQQILTASLGARDSSMLNIASSSVVSSRMSLNQSSDEDDDDDFGDAISMVLGIAPSETPRKKEKATNANEDEQKPDDKKKERGKKEKDKKPKKEKKEKKDKKGKEGKHRKEKEEHKEEIKPVKDAERPKGERKPAAPMTPPLGKTAKSPKVPPATTATKTTKTTSANKATKAPKTPPATRDNKLGKAPPASKATKTSVTHPTKAEPKKPEKPLVSKSPGKTRKMMVQPSPPIPHKEQEVRLRATETSSPPLASAPKAPRRERIAQPPLRHSEKPTTPSKKEVPSSTAVGREEHMMSVTVPVRGQSSQTGPREVRNQFFDDESDEEPGVPEVLEEKAELSEADQIEDTIRTMTDDLTRFLEEAKWTSPTTSKHTEATPKKSVLPPPALHSVPSQSHKISEPTHKVDLIEVDETSKDIFGDDGLAELNDALMQLSTIQAGFSPGSAVHKAVTQTDDTKEKQGASKQQKLSGIDRDPPQTNLSDDSKSSAASESEEATYEFSATQKGNRKTQDKPRSNDRNEGELEHETQEVVLSFVGDDSTSSSVPRTSKPAGSQHPMQGMPRSTSFEQNVLATLNSLNETINQMKANPSATQTEINQQQQIQQQLIQNMLTYSQNDPQLMSKLLGLLQDKDTQQEAMESSSSHQLEQLEHKLLDVQQKQLHETKEHFRTQAEFQQAIQRKLEEQAEQQMKGIQSNFDKYSQLLEQQLAEQRRKWEEEMKRRDEEERAQREKYRTDKDKKKHKSRDKRHKKKRHKHYSDSESSATDSGDDLVQPSPRTIVPKPAVKTMQAKIYTQELLDPSKILEESLPEPPVVPRVNQLPGNEKQKVALKRRETALDFSRTTDALRRFEGEVEEEEEEEEDDEMQFQHAKPVTLRRADIIKMQDTNDYTPHRSHGAREATKERRAASGMKGNKAEMRKVTAADDEFRILRPKSPKFIETKEPAPEFDESRLKYGHQHVEPNEHKKNVSPGDPLVAGADGELTAVLRVRQMQLKKK